jgi:hypothetical protein
VNDPLGSEGPTILHVYTLQVRLQAQVEQALTLLGQQGQMLADYELRLRAVETAGGENRAACKNVRGAVDDHEKRMRWLEKWMRALPASTLIALIAAIGSIVSSVVNP